LYAVYEKWTFGAVLELEQWPERESL
jgi:hypothetical protein